MEPFDRSRLDIGKPAPDSLGRILATAGGDGAAATLPRRRVFRLVEQLLATSGGRLLEATVGVMTRRRWERVRGFYEDFAAYHAGPVVVVLRIKEVDRIDPKWAGLLADDGR